MAFAEDQGLVVGLYPIFTAHRENEKHIIVDQRIFDVKSYCDSAPARLEG